MTAVISPRAERDLEDIWMFVSTGSERSADRLLQELLRKINQIGDSVPHRGHVRAELHERPVLTINLRTWVIFYAVNVGGDVDILRVVHGGRDMGQLRL